MFELRKERLQHGSDVVSGGMEEGMMREGGDEGSKEGEVVRQNNNLGLWELRGERKFSIRLLHTLPVRPKVSELNTHALCILFQSFFYMYINVP